MRATQGLFRDEALRHYLDRRQWGDVLRLPPAWTRWTYPFLLAVFTVGVGFLLFGSLPQQVVGPAVVRATRKVAVEAPVAGTVVSVEVLPGQRVAAGDVLARLADAGGSPRELRAPRAGVVRDLRLREGQSVDRGDEVLAVIPREAGQEVLAFLPAKARSALHPGAHLRLVLPQAPREPLPAVIRWIADAPIPASEARRLFEGSGTEVLPDASGVLVRAEVLDSPAARGAGENALDGMRARAEVGVGSERLLFALVPGLKPLLER